MKLIQQRYADDPWKVLVCCQLLNLTSGRQVVQVLDRLFSRWPSADEMARADARDVEDVIRFLGLQNRRARVLVQFSQWWTRNRRLDPDGLADRVKVLEPPGIGEYARDAWMIVVEGPTRDNLMWAMTHPRWPADKELKRWLDLVRSSDVDAFEQWWWDQLLGGRR